MDKKTGPSVNFAAPIYWVWSIY